MIEFQEEMGWGRAKIWLRKCLKTIMMYLQISLFFSKKRGNPNYIPQDRQKMEHVEEVLYLLSAVTGDNRYQEICEENIEEVQTMCDVAQRLEDRGIEKGKSEGERDGSLKMLYRLVASKALDIDVAVKEAKKYGVKDAVDFRRLAKLAGYEIK